MAVGALVALLMAASATRENLLLQMPEPSQTIVPLLLVGRNHRTSIWLPVLRYLLWYCSCGLESESRAAVSFAYSSLVRTAAKASWRPG
jgi:hypothetical protein